MKQPEFSFIYTSKFNTIGKFIFSFFLFLLFIIAIILIGVGFSTIGDNGNLLEGFKYAFPGLTILIVISLGLLYTKINNRTKLVGAYFDLANKRYYLETKNGESGYIPFSEIQSLGMRKEVVSGNKSSTNYYVIYLVKTDGAWWDVMSYESEITALKKLNELQEKVNFDSEGEFNLLEKETSSKFFSIQTKAGSVIFKWGEQVSFLYRILGLFSVLSFLGSFWIISSALGQAGVVGNFLLTGISILFGGLVLYSFLKSIFGYTNYELEVNREKIIFYGVKKDKRKIISETPVIAIKFTQYSYNMYRNDLFNGQEILLLDQEFANRINKFRNGELGIVEIISLMKEIVQMKKNIIKLPFPGFKSLDIILFEKKLDEELRKINPKLK
ncbi:MAG: hypothetical protein IPL26_07875 [Leptospiraceae bacterium]|nr:hypothetical protein [Leptospiraceae bacterium]